MKFASVQQLAQVALTTGGGTTLVFTGAADNTELTRIVCVFGGASGVLELFHDEDGTTYTAATQVLYEAASARMVTVESPAIGSGIGVRRDGNIAASVGSGSADGTITIYGVVEALPEET